MSNYQAKDRITGELHISDANSLSQAQLDFKSAGVKPCEIMKDGVLILSLSDSPPLRGSFAIANESVYIHGIENLVQAFDFLHDAGIQLESLYLGFADDAPIRKHNDDDRRELVKA